MFLRALRYICKFSESIINYSLNVPWKSGVIFETTSTKFSSINVDNISYITRYFCYKIYINLSYCLACIFSSIAPAHLSIKPTSENINFIIKS